MDANDLTVELLGKSEQLQNWPDSQLLALIVDNPAGQDRQLTPFILIRDFVKVCMTAKIHRGILFSLMTAMQKSSKVMCPAAGKKKPPLGTYSLMLGFLVLTAV
ncbi:MAG: hypothetical protein V8S11_11675 [Flavonifractor plautii]